ncbi:hypothetical protein [Streptomyces gilvosporeus]|uniref:Ternary complex associated domain-containing protein n=1 Tax=Streptomyces gilvosporeus TaxID=553510 RepID=A0A1V0TM96_9ACTN|nr:hypothetical protein [Streptomyces gilvosporeus]ARF54059.1 hypothetical protein B1H19_07515 [Streptomyces gilvosporeus]
MVLQVEFAPACGIDLDEQGDIVDALCDVAALGDDIDIEEDESPPKGYWPADVHTVTVLRRLAGGRSGSEVLEIEVGVKKAAGFLQVAKLMSHDEAVQEWSAFTALARKHDDTLYVPIVAVSRSVIDKQFAVDFKRHVVVYAHVRDRDQNTEGTLRSLEDVVVEAIRDPDATAQGVATLSAMMSTLRNKLYRSAASASDQLLRQENWSLGPNVVLTADRIDAGGQGRVRLIDGNPGAEDLKKNAVTSTSLLKASTAPPGAGRSLVEDKIRLMLNDGAVDGAVVSGEFNGVRVHVELTGAAGDRTDVTELIGKRPLDVYGAVQQTRSQCWSDLFAARMSAKGDFTETESHLTYDGVAVEHPVKSLLNVLSASAEARTRSHVHGDLNPRNIMFCDKNPYLIDFASFEVEGYLLADLAWMEVCTLRDCVSPLLSWADLVRLQRYLALLTVVTPLWEADAVASAAAFLVESFSQDAPELSRCLELLWALRLGIWKMVPTEDREAWPRHYFQHLTLAACRTFKWEAAHQSEQQVGASTAIAGVASECLTPEFNNFFDQWTAGQAQLAYETLLGNSDELNWASADLLTAALVAGGVDPPRRPGSAARQTTERLFSGPLAPTVEELQRHCRDREFDSSQHYHDFTYIPLEGRVLAPGEPYVQQGEGALTVAPRSCLSLLAQHDVAVLVADSGSGKSVVVRELKMRMMSAFSKNADPAVAARTPCCLPMSLSAAQLSSELHTASDLTPSKILRGLVQLPDELSQGRLERLLEVGAVHLTVDDLHKVELRHRRGVAVWLKDLHVKHPQVRIVVCQRGGDYQPEDFGWPAVVLHKVREGPARTFIADELRKRYQMGWQAKCAQLGELLFKDPSAVALRELAGRPLFLKMLVRHFVDTGEVPSNPGVLVHEYLARMLKSGEHAIPVAQQKQMLNKLVSKLGDSGSLSREEAVQVIEDPTREDAEQDLETLLSTTAVEQDASRITFCNPLVQALCAASVLLEDAQDQVSSVTDRIRKFGWRDAALFLVADPHADEETVAAVLRTAVEANPWYGAMLLQAAPENAVPDVREAFLAAQHGVLRSEASGRPAWRRSAYALAKYGARSAMDVLEQVALDENGAPEAVKASLDGLVMMHQWFVPDATSTLQEVLCHLLDPPPGVSVEGSVIVRALRSIQAAGLTSMAGHAWSRMEQTGASWEVISQAWDTLAQLGVLPNRTLRAIHAQACKRQLFEIDRKLAGTAATSTAERLNEERLSLLKRLAAEGDIESLLAYRFRAGLAECPDWPEMLERAARAAQAVDPQHVLAGVLLDREMLGMRPDGWRDLLTQSNEHLAMIAAHRLLSDGRVLGASSLEQVGGQASAKRLSIVAAFVHSLSPDDQGVLERLLEPVLATLTPEFVDPVACVVSAAGTLGPELGLRLALRVQEALMEHGLERQAVHWPWCTTWRQVLPLRAETALFVEEQGIDSPTLTTLLGSVDVLLDAPFVQPMVLAPAVRQQLLSLQPKNPDGVAAHQFVMLAASAGLYEALPFVHDVAQSQHNIGTIITHSHGEHGLVQVSLAAHATTAIGYLGSLALLEDLMLEAEAAEQALHRLAHETDSLHPSLERARLVGLGYWGHWQELLSALSPDDPVLVAAARNIVTHWLPGPRDRLGEACFHSIARWTARELATGKLPASTQAVLTHIRDSTENRLGRYVR